MFAHPYCGLKLKSVGALNHWLRKYKYEHDRYLKSSLCLCVLAYKHFAAQVLTCLKTSFIRVAKELTYIKTSFISE